MNGIDHAPEVDDQLASQREEVGGVEDGSQRSDVRQRVHWRRVGERQRSCGERRAGRDHLVIATADAVEVEHREGVGADQAGEHENLLHLDRRHERAPTLPDDVDRAANGWDAGGKRRRHGGVAEFYLRSLLVLEALHLLHHLRPPGRGAHAAVGPRARRLPGLGLGDHARGGGLHGAELGPLLAGGGSPRELLLEPNLLERDEFLLVLLPGCSLPGARLFHLGGLLLDALHLLRERLRLGLRGHGHGLVILGAFFVLLADGGHLLRVCAAKAAEQRHPNVRLLERADVVSAVSAHERVPALLLEPLQNALLVVRGHPREDDDRVEVIPEASVAAAATCALVVLHEALLAETHAVDRRRRVEAGPGDAQ
mmetsp:Transcript_12071/g.52005  ORF Transcript_12071/g.52005 Transcript_12071/m.52005 type:complete len:369 (+) Transcript_12071:1070-2176(+)